MADARRRPRFTPEALPLLSVSAVRAQTLDGDRPVEALVVRGIDDAHASFAQLAHDAIAAGFHVS